MSESLVNSPQVFDRKKFMHEKSLEFFDHRFNGASKRQMVLMSQNADALSDRQLRTHVREMRTRKFFRSAALVTLPLVMFGLKFPNQVVVYSLIPGIYFNSKIFNSSFFNFGTDFSYLFAQKSFKKHEETIL